MPGLTITFPANADSVAVAVSGGADSMALVHMLGSAGTHKIHAITVDHRLRVGSAIEANDVGEWLAQFPNVKHTVLQWHGHKPASGVMENARAARYALMAEYCRDHDIHYLALGHHRDDQAETFLMRLASGSGIDGLSGMRDYQVYADDLTLWRPLLAYAHEDLVAYCRDKNMRWVEDPTNQNLHYTRNRLRAARDVLDAEGLSAKRLATTARRLDRASDALRVLSQRLSAKTTIEKNVSAHVFDLAGLKAEPFELAVRVIRTALQDMGSGGIYGPRFEKVENAAEILLGTASAKTLTLGGCILRAQPRRGTLSILREAAENGAKTLPLAANGL